MASTPALSLDLIFPEIREMIFKEAMIEREDALNLISALLTLHRNDSSSLYTEALHTYYQLHPCIIDAENMNRVEKLSDKMRISAQNLLVDLSCKMDPLTLKTISTETVASSTTRTRINPKPSYLETLRPYPNIKHLRLDSQTIAFSSFHQIEGMITEALKRHRYLERLEVRSDMLDWEWIIKGGVEENNHQRWIGRINAGTDVSGKLTRVSTFGFEVCWFWQAAAGQTLGWKTKENVLCRKRKRV